MKTIQEVYPGKFTGTSDYGPMLESIGTVVVQVDDPGYQGDSRVLFRDGERWGVLLFGWGSCSGCDALQGCSSFDDVEKLRDELVTSVRWGTREETIALLRTKDWSVEPTAYRAEEARRFVEQALAALESAT